VAKKRNKESNFLASNWLFPQTTHVDVATEILYELSSLGSSHIFQVSRKAGEGSQSCRALVENRPLPLTWPIAYTTACTIVLYRKTAYSLSSVVQTDAQKQQPTFMNSTPRIFGFFAKHLAS